ncbi:protein of unknown function [Burkholderia multivorans]
MRRGFTRHSVASAWGNSTRSDSARGDSVRGDSVRGDSARRNSTWGGLHRAVRPGVILRGAARMVRREPGTTGPLPRRSVSRRGTKRSQRAQAGRREDAHRVAHPARPRPA